MDSNKGVTTLKNGGGGGGGGERLKWFVPFTLRLRGYDEGNERNYDFSNSVSTIYKMFVAAADDGEPKKNNNAPNSVFIFFQS